MDKTKRTSGSNATHANGGFALRIPHFFMVRLDTKNHARFSSQWPPLQRNPERDVENILIVHSLSNNFQIVPFFLLKPLQPTHANPHTESRFLTGTAY